MKTIYALGSMISALCLGWHHHGMNESASSADSKSAELTAQIETSRRELQTANTRIAQLSGRAPAVQPAGTNWIQEKNRNWQSSLARGAYDNRKAVTIVPSQVIVVGPPPPPYGYTAPGTRALSPSSAPLGGASSAAPRTVIVVPAQPSAPVSAVPPPQPSGAPPPGARPPPPPGGG